MKKTLYHALDSSIITGADVHEEDVWGTTMLVTTIDSSSSAAKHLLDEGWSEHPQAIIDAQSIPVLGGSDSQAADLEQKIVDLTAENGVLTEQNEQLKAENQQLQEAIEQYLKEVVEASTDDQAQPDTDKAATATSDAGSSTGKAAAKTTRKTTK